MSNNIRKKPNLITPISKQDEKKKTLLTNKPKTLVKKQTSIEARKTKEEEKLQPKRPIQVINSKSNVKSTKFPIISKDDTKRFKDTVSTSKSKATVTNKPITTKTTVGIGKARTINNASGKSAQIIAKPNLNKNIANTKSNKVMTTFHNVTVLSPPSKRKNIDANALINSVSTNKPPKEIEKVERPRTRTLSRSSALPLEYSSLSDEATMPVIKEPIAFDVVFPHKEKPPNNNNLVKTVPDTYSDSEESSSQNYADDFESYESDFETESSSSDASSIEHSAEDVNNSNFNTDDDYSEETQLPITVIHREKENECKLDSGNFDISSKSRQLSTPQQNLDSLDTSIINAEQLDSGFSHSFLSKRVDNAEVTYGGRRDFYSSSKLSKRGKELMQKIQLDTITFSLFDVKSISYDQYMRVYGKINSVQSSTQTKENFMNTDSQTDGYQMRTVWTQHPPNYNLEDDVKTSKFGAYRQHFFGEAFEEITKNYDKTNILILPSSLDESLQAMQTFRRNEKRKTVETRTQIDFDRLNEFLNRSSFIISKIVNKIDQKRNLQASRLGDPVSHGYYKLDTKFLNALKVVRVFSNPRYNTILTVHESIADIYSSDFSNLIMVWNTIEATKPIRLLSSWSEVCRADICNEKSDIIVGGLRDGCIAMWDLRETYSFCSKLDGYLTLFPATQSITPSWGGSNFQLNDLGAVVDIKSFRLPEKNFKATNYKTIQFVSLNESGILTIWTLLKTEKTIYGNINDRSQLITDKFEYLSPWARVKLIQSAIYDLREYLELKNVRPSSGFDLAKSHFEKDIFNDQVLRELNETRLNMKLGLQGLRFTNLDTGVERIFIGTNRNFILTCSKTLKTERFHKVFIDDSKFLFPTALRLLVNENFLAVGLSNGSVIILNCNENKNSKIQSPTETRSISTAFKEPNRILFENDIGKSCTIQNIILNERKTNDDEINSRHDYGSLTNSEHFNFDYNNSNNTKSIDYRIFDHQILLSGSVLRKDLVQSIEVSKDGRRLFALSDGEIRTYDFLLENEISGSSSTKVQEICIASNQGDNQSLVLLTDDENIQVHLLK